jgi:hypothetical protein
MANEWREHALLQGRFPPDYADDLQVIVHDGGPQITRNEPEIVWVTVTGISGDLFRGRVRNQPHNLQTVRRGDEIKFLVPEGDAPATLLELATLRLGLHRPPLRGWLFPILVTDKYLRERGEWVIHACPQCGLTELFDAPSDLIRVLFPQPPRDANMTSFVTSCPHCGAAQRVESRGSPAAGDPGPVRTAENRDFLYLITVELLVENMTKLGALLATIKDDASADLALPGLERAVAYHNDLSKKLESYQMSTDDHMRLAREDGRYLAAHSDMTVSTFAARANAMDVQSKAPGRAKDIEGAMRKIGLADGPGHGIADKGPS